MTDRLYFNRDTRVLVKLNQGTAAAFEIPVLEGFSFSQATNASEVTLNEMSDSTGSSRRAKQMFNDSYAPAEWSFSTYAQPEGSTGYTQCSIEAVLWGLLAGEANYHAGTKSFRSDTNTPYIEEINEDATNKQQVSFAQSNKTRLGTADIYFVMGGVNPGANDKVLAYKLDQCCVNEVTFDFDIEGIATLNWSGMGKIIKEVEVVTGTSTAPNAAAVGDLFLNRNSGDIQIALNTSGSFLAVTKDESSNFIKNRLTTLSLNLGGTATQGSGGTPVVNSPNIMAAVDAPEVDADYVYYPGNIIPSTSSETPSNWTNFAPNGNGSHGSVAWVSTVDTSVADPQGDGNYAIKSIPNSALSNGGGDLLIYGHTYFDTPVAMVEGTDYTFSVYIKNSGLDRVGIYCMDSNLGSLIESTNLAGDTQASSDLESMILTIDFTQSLPTISKRSGFHASQGQGINQALHVSNESITPVSGQVGWYRVSCNFNADVVQKAKTASNSGFSAFRVGLVAVSEEGRGVMLTSGSDILPGASYNGTNHVHTYGWQVQGGTTLTNYSASTSQQISRVSNWSDGNTTNVDNVNVWKDSAANPITGVQDIDKLAFIGFGEGEPTGFDLNHSQASVQTTVLNGTMQMNQDYTFSFYIKGDGGEGADYIGIRFSQANSNTYATGDARGSESVQDSFVMDFTGSGAPTASFVTGNLTTPTITAVTGQTGWYRVSTTLNDSTAGTQNLIIAFVRSDAQGSMLMDTNAEFTGGANGTDGWWIANMQVEEGSTATAYMLPGTSTGGGGTSGGVQGGTNYDLTLTGGSITVSNNMTFVTPETLGVVNQPLAHVTGTRSITGSFTCYLNSMNNGSADLLETLVEATDTVTNVTNLNFKVGGASATPRIEFSMPTAHMEIPVHSIEDVISVEANFHALPSAIDGTDELTLKYVSA